MHSLLFALLRALRSHVWLRLLACAFVLSSLGNGLTQVVVFGQLLRWQASPTLLTLAWLLATLPGFAGSLLGERLCQTWRPLQLLIFSELLGLVALVLPWQGISLHSIPFLLAVQSAESLLCGMAWPALALMFSRSLGQLCGPLLLNSQKMAEYTRRNHLLLGCLTLFLLAYMMMPTLSAYTGAALAAIFIAHLASNVVFALGTFGVLYQFDKQEVSGASAKAWRWQTLSATFATSVTVLLTGMLGAVHTLWCVSFCSLMLVGGILFHYRN